MPSAADSGLAPNRLEVEITESIFLEGGEATLRLLHALRSLGELDLRSALPRISVPTWFVNGQFDQLRLNERLFTRLACRPAGGHTPYTS